ncbi:MAG: hypothetical protein ABS76_13770 [Pelagibacterium sp. SCN 64-44]|nr:MAG: hypothetical protein ABS76_13770 [Pelagibacterium sp. SCN 64-44]
MIKAETLIDAIECIVKQETKLVDAYIAAVRTGDDRAADVTFYKEVLHDLIDVRSHIYDLLLGINAPSKFVENKTGMELVTYFGEESPKSKS